MDQYGSGLEAKVGRFGQTKITSAELPVSLGVAIHLEWRPAQSRGRSCTTGVSSDACSQEADAKRPAGSSSL